ncbi:hypothetical protein [Fictibacillus sp. FJAT-27399]|uniref:hypothetical protein n=1 Tax=Fictibacillus sp. FJAT-27399 TaxID=1729689 RepID=UPI00078522C5|nr:hypothetical protein [Fictibacillus sp. FJAT-27399]
MNNEQNTAFCKLLKEHLERLQDPAESLQSGGSINEMFRTFIRMKTTGLGTKQAFFWQSELWERKRKIQKENWEKDLLLFAVPGPVRYGLNNDNFIGTIPQPNGLYSTWTIVLSSRSFEFIWRNIRSPHRSNSKEIFIVVFQVADHEGGIVEDSQ